MHLKPVETVADNLDRTAFTGWVRLVPDEYVLTLPLMSASGSTCVPATGPNFNNGVLSGIGG